VKTILVINPNTTESMTDAIGVAAKAVVGPEFEIVVSQPSFGPRSIEGHFDEVIAAAGVAEQVRQYVERPLAGVVIACFGDPGLDAAREATDAPVLGIAEAAFHAASMLATGFSVVTTMSRTCILAERLVQRYGFERHCRGIHGTDIPVLALESDPAQVLNVLEASAREALVRDRSGAIVLGCAGMAAQCLALQDRLGVPVIDGVAVAVKWIEALSSLKLRTSKRGDYADPLPKEYSGWSAPLGWPCPGSSDYSAS